MLFPCPMPAISVLCVYVLTDYEFGGNFQIRSELLRSQRSGNFESITRLVRVFLCALQGSEHR